AFGDAWDPHYGGIDPDGWGKEAEEFLRYQFYPNCNLRGPQYNLGVSMNLSGQAWDVDGDDAMILTETENGFPALAFFPATKIASQGANLRGSFKPGNLVEGGPYDGARIFDGIIYDRNSRIVALRIMGEDGTYQDISSFNSDLAYEPKWSDQGRGIPLLATSMLKWLDLQDVDDFLRRGLKRASAIGLKVKKEEGEAGLGNELITTEDNPSDPANAHKIAYEEIEGGEMYYLTAGVGEDIEGLSYKNPHPNTEAFIQRVTRCALNSIGWFYELMDLRETGRAPSRLLCGLANQSIWSRQKTGL